MQISFLIPIMVTAVGGFLLFKLKFFFIAHPIRTAGEFIVAAKDRAARRSLFLALAGTLGVGNIFGVAAGIMIGGEGSVLWLLLSSIFAMVIKYSETLMVFDASSGGGGMAGALKGIFPRFSHFISPAYAFMTILLSLFMGSAMQSAAVVDVASKTLNLSPTIIAFMLVILLLPCVIGKNRRIESVTEIVIPVTTIIYIFMSFCVIAMNFSQIPHVFSRILSSAFSLRSILGGTVMSVSMLAIKEGFARGILSNEAGVGTSALGHSRYRERTPHVAGLFGMCEVFFDTTVLCMLTAFVILISVDDISAFSTPMSLVNAAFSQSLGDASSRLLTILIFAFAYSTIICWYSYGLECVSIYFPVFELFFAPSFLSFVLISSVISSALLISVIDLILLIMSFITLSAIVKRLRRIQEISKI